jgi:hypothetical protein
MLSYMIIQARRPTRSANQANVLGKDPVPASRRDPDSDDKGEVKNVVSGVSPFRAGQ